MVMRYWQVHAGAIATTQIGASGQSWVRAKVIVVLIRDDKLVTCNAQCAVAYYCQHLRSCKQLFMPLHKATHQTSSASQHACTFPTHKLLNVRCPPSNLQSHATHNISYACYRLYFIWHHTGPVGTFVLMSWQARAFSATMCSCPLHTSCTPAKASRDCCALCS